MSEVHVPPVRARGATWIVVIAAVVLVVAIIQAIVGTYAIAALSGAVGVLLLVLGLRMWRLTRRVQMAMAEQAALGGTRDFTN